MLDGSSVAVSAEEQPAAMKVRVTATAASLDIFTFRTVETASERKVTN